MRNLV
ncbi:hypothetical protein Pint_34398 [Pistacia integerrima]